MPFDDDNLRVLLEKVKRGRFSVPAYVPNGAQELIRGMIDVNPKTRLTVNYREFPSSDVICLFIVGSRY